MFLSNSAKSFLICGFVLLTVPACKWWQRSDSGNVNSSSPDNVPFATAEPDAFQCEIIRSDGETEQKTFFVRKGGNWRFDLNASEAVLTTDKTYRLDTDKKIYSELPQGDSSAAEPEFLSDMTFSALKQNKNARFESLGKDGDLSKYSVTLDDSDNARAIIYVDEKNGLVMKEEFFSLKGATNQPAKPVFVFELRDVKIDVDDSVFTIPAGFKKLAWNDYLASIKPKK